MKKADEIKNYNQILDEFSLHQFVIRKGVTMSDTEEFLSYKRTYEYMWQLINPVIKQLEQYARDAQIPLCHVDGKKILSLK